MVTIFDFLTTACFAMTAVGFFRFTDRAIKTLMHLMPPSVAFAVGNQLGNVGYSLFALLLIVAGMGYAGLVLRQHPQ